MAPDFKKFPELRNSQMQFYYFQSPHKQIFEDFNCRCVKVVDGDTIRVKWEERDFDFPIRFLDTDAPEIKDRDGDVSKKWLAEKILNKEIQVRIDKNRRVGKFGRLLGHIWHNGMNINKLSITTGHAVPFNSRNDGKILDLDQILKRGEIK